MVEERSTELVGDQLENLEDHANKKVKLEKDEPEIGDELKQKIAKQIEYYFSDVNLTKDKFMQEQLKKNDNCVKLSVLATFNRLAQLTKDENVMVQALKGVESDFMEVDEVKKHIRRKLPLPNREEYLKELDTRTIHISGFPDFIKFDDLSRFCSRFGEIESLSMRQHFKTKQFKGCIHVVFKNQADAQKILDGPELVFKDRELRRESMQEYHERKERIKKHRIDKRKNKNSEEINEEKSGVKLEKGGEKLEEKSDEKLGEKSGDKLEEKSEDKLEEKTKVKIEVKIEK